MIIKVQGVNIFLSILLSLNIQYFLNLESISTFLFVSLILPKWLIRQKFSSFLNVFYFYFSFFFFGFIYSALS